MLFLGLAALQCLSETVGLYLWVWERIINLIATCSLWLFPRAHDHSCQRHIILLTPYAISLPGTHSKAFEPYLSLSQHFECESHDHYATRLIWLTPYISLSLSLSCVFVLYEWGCTYVSKWECALKNFKLEALLGKIVHVIRQMAGQHLDEHFVEKCACNFHHIPPGLSQICMPRTQIGGIVEALIIKGLPPEELNWITKEKAASKKDQKKKRKERKCQEANLHK